MTLPHYTYRGARACVILHDEKLREFVAIWKENKAAGNMPLPATDDPDYQSYDHLLRHVLRAARGYMRWCCAKLDLPDPAIPPTPEADDITAQVDAYLEILLEKWQTPLVSVPESRFDEVYPSNWKIDYCIDAMLEHAVMHPIRHTFQLLELRGK